MGPTTQVIASNVALLLQRIASRDPEAVSELYDLQSAVLYSVIVRVLGSETDAGDVLQEVFLRVWENAHLYHPGISPPSAWLIRIARDLAVGRLRSEMFKSPAMEQNVGLFDDVVDSGETARSDDAAIHFEHRDEIIDALRQLSGDQRDLIEFAYYRGYTQSDLAEHFKLPPGTVKTRVCSTMSFLRTRLQQLM